MLTTSDAHATLTTGTLSIPRTRSREYAAHPSAGGSSGRSLTRFRAGVDLARRRKGRPAVRLRKRSVRRRSASRHRRRGRSRHRREVAGVGHRDLRGHRANRRQDNLDPDARRLHGHAPTSRFVRRSQRRGRERRRHGRDRRNERRARLARALRLPRDPGHRGRPGIRRSAHAAADAGRAGPGAALRRRHGAVTRAGGCACSPCSNAPASACSRIRSAACAERRVDTGGEPVTARGRSGACPRPGARAGGGAACADVASGRFHGSSGRISVCFGGARAPAAGAQSLSYTHRSRRSTDRAVRRPRCRLAETACRPGRASGAASRSAATARAAERDRGLRAGFQTRGRSASVTCRGSGACPDATVATWPATPVGSTAAGSYSWIVPDGHGCAGRSALPSRDRAALLGAAPERERGPAGECRPRVAAYDFRQCGFTRRRRSTT